MNSWLVYRTASCLLTVFLLITTAFFVVRLAPGDPVDQLIGTDAGTADRETLRRQLGLDRSLGAQYADWLGGIVRGDFGESLRQQRPVREIVLEAMGPTLQLAGSAYVLQLVLAFGAALLAASGRARRLSDAIQTTGLVLYSLPLYWLGLMMVLLLSGQAGWFPAAGMEAPDAALLPAWQQFADRLRHLALPVTALGLWLFMGTARYLQAGLEEALGQDYVLAARSRGVPERRILTRHVLRNALLPVITLAGLQLPMLLGGSVVVENVFAWPGLGRISVEAIFARDYPVVMAAALLTAIAVTLGSLLADIAYRWADPRLRRDEGGRP